MRSLTILLTIALSKLNNAEYLNLMSRLQKLVETATPTAVGLTSDEFDEFKDLVEQLQDRINYPTASDRTAHLTTLDKQRDSVLTFIFSTINNSKKVPILELSEAGNALTLIIRPYTSIQSDQDQVETVKIKGILKDLDTEEAKAHLATLNLTDAVAKLKEINDEYETVTAARARDKEAARMSSDSGTNLRKRLDPIFEAIRQITLAESIAKPTEVTAEFILGLNSAIREVNTLYNLRTGKTQSGEDETVLPGTDPETPEEPQEPDGDSGTPGEV